jgi:hypothetical protein
MTTGAARSLPTPLLGALPARGVRQAGPGRRIDAVRGG